MQYWITPARFNRFSKKAQPAFIITTILLMMAGLYGALIASPPDYQQGEAVRIMYVHVPAAWMGSFLYAMMALFSVCFLVWRHPLADVLAREAAPIGAIFTLVTLATGMIWGKPMWGAYWVWDA